MVREQPGEIFYELRLKTGFFETTPYRFYILKGHLRLVPDKTSARGNIEIPEEDLVSVALTKDSRLRITISTQSQTFTGTFVGTPDLREVSEYLKNRVYKPIICEEA